jgi:hypothetical protein
MGSGGFRPEHESGDFCLLRYLRISRVWDFETSRILNERLIIADEMDYHNGVAAHVGAAERPRVSRERRHFADVCF